MALELLLKLDAMGFKVTPEGDSIRVRGRLTDELRQAIRQHKAQLLRLIRWRSDRKAQAQSITEALRTRGWAVVSGGQFRGRVVLLVRDGAVSVPEAYRGYKRYALGELLEAARSEAQPGALTRSGGDDSWL